MTSANLTTGSTQKLNEGEALFNSSSTSSAYIDDARQERASTTERSTQKLKEGEASFKSSSTNGAYIDKARQERASTTEDLFVQKNEPTFFSAGPITDQQTLHKVSLHDAIIFFLRSNSLEKGHELITSIKT